MTKKITIVFSVYNVAPYVERSLLSILEQDYPNLEVLVIDDRGTDNSMEIIEHIIDSNPRGKDVHIITHPHNIGLGGTRNTGMDNATGEYIFFMDSDDTLTPCAISALVNTAIKTKSVLIVGSFQRVNTLETTTYMGQYTDKTFISNYDIIKEYFQNKAIAETSWAKLYHLPFLKETGIRFIDKCNNEDTPFTFLLMLKLPNLSTCSIIVYNWLEREGSVTSQIREKNVNDSLNGFTIMVEELSRHKGNPLYPLLLTYVSNTRLHAIWLLLKKRVKTERKSEFLDIATIPLLTCTEIHNQPLPLYEKVKQAIFTLPKPIKHALLRVISITQL